ncbi:peptide chain release factor N(5)-glutamine methyltransferase [Amphritea sp. 1_MG-2023]|uniref:peptide chain release factor N(5)-glutamine methyltransferase n=1 Tax=Amphritea sp. 1_MG-2023 TaxID=3062670 RepID=UPI0026E2AFBA|nr:peptide chain release factor N(5)-glutamine methyltransferase [Amphritea sp. 1_MG-2023]MDO6564884.1 peptide chain release factor N(5)-glutamine methyltransferase [Amphritea sp. 1_MG-2023]
MNIFDAQRQAAQLAAKSDSPVADVELLLCYILGCNRTFLFTHSDQRLTEAQQLQFEQLLERRLQGEPIAHLTGTRGFWNLELEVNASTLIPRPDTECLVEKALQLISPATARVLDLGTGTGAIALSLADERPAWSLVAVDRIAEAVTLAERNRQRAGLENVTVLQGSWFEPVDGVFDLIVSNPPYIDPQDPHLMQGDVRFEPRSALVAEEGGLADIRYIASQASDFLAAGGLLLFEHGYDQTAAVQQLLLELHYTDIESAQDYGGNDRLTWARWPINSVEKEIK